MLTNTVSFDLHESPQDNESCPRFKDEQAEALRAYSFHFPPPPPGVREPQRLLKMMKSEIRGFQS